MCTRFCDAINTNLPVWPHLRRSEHVGKDEEKRIDGSDDQKRSVGSNRLVDEPTTRLRLEVIHLVSRVFGAEQDGIVAKG